MTHTLRINFDGKEWDTIMFLMREKEKNTPQKLIRYLIDAEADRLRGDKMRYGKVPSVPRETKEQRWSALEKLDDATLNARLEELHAFDEYKSGPDMLVFVDTDALGRRLLRQRSASEDNEMPFGTFFNQIKKKISL